MNLSNTPEPDTAQSGAMSKVAKVKGRTPPRVLQAVEAFNSELRVRLIRHYLEHPGSQVAAAEALGLNTGTITRNTRTLIQLGVVQESLDPDNHRSRLYRVRRARYFELVQALHDFAAEVGEDAPGDGS